MPTPKVLRDAAQYSGDHGGPTGPAQNAVPLDDLPSTFSDLAMLGESIDGRSLVPLMRGVNDPADEAIGEYGAERTGFPAIMIQRGRLKYEHCDSDPPQLCDPSSDPLETRKVATDPNYASAAAEFAAEFAVRWDGEALRNQIIATQKSRRAGRAAMEAGANVPRDYTQHRDASQSCVRNYMDWTVAVCRYRNLSLKDQTS